MLHVDIPTHAQLERLLRARHPASVSIYVPTTPITAEVAASRIDLRNAIEEALDQLRTVDLDKRQLADLEERAGEYARARALFDRVYEHDPEFADVATRRRTIGRS